MKVLKTVLVINRAGVEMRKHLYESFKVTGRYNYGVKVDVIEETDLWVGVMEHLTRSFVKNGDSIIREERAKIKVPKSKFGEEFPIVLINDALNVIYSLNIGKNSHCPEKAHRLPSHLKTELIDKSFFESWRSTAVNFLLADTNAIKRRGPVLELPIANITVRYAAIPDTTDLAQTFTRKDRSHF